MANIRQRANLSISIWVSPFLLLFFLSMLTGFDFSDPGKVRQELRQELIQGLEKIREQTPDAKKRAKWRKSREEAVAALMAAKSQQAARFAPKEWDEAVELFLRAREYAARRSYLKADYLARQSKKQAEKARLLAVSKITTLEKRLGERLQDLGDRLRQLSGMVPPDADALSLRASELMLALSDARLAMELRQFKEAEQGLQQAEHDIAMFRKDLYAYLEAHPPQELEDGGFPESGHLVEEQDQDDSSVQKSPLPGNTILHPDERSAIPDLQQ